MVPLSRQMVRHGIASFMVRLETVRAVFAVVGTWMFLACPGAFGRDVPQPPRPAAPPPNALLTAATNVGIKRCRPALARDT